MEYHTPEFKQEVGRKYCEWYHNGAYRDSEFIQIMTNFPFCPSDMEDLVEPYGSVESILGWATDNNYISAELYDRVLDSLEAKELRVSRVWASPQHLEGYTHYNLGILTAEKRRERLRGLRRLLGLTDG